MEYAQIEVTQHTIDPLGQRYRTYKWLGKKHLPVMISWDFEDYLSELPFKLKRVDGDESFGYFTYIREDAYFPLGWLFEAKIKLQNGWRWFFYRFIATLNVWGLAKTPAGSVPSWKDIGRK